jgi:methylenetetrahydrofolate--tRNA-(uracil-5-)-methyltransferase
MPIQPVTVIGAGLAGCEAAWQLARHGVPVYLHEMKPSEFSPAHHQPGYAELVCSNSLGSGRIENAAGLLKEEMRRLGSLIIACADLAALPAGGALAVDRELFSRLVTEKIQNESLISVKTGRVESIPRDNIVIVATGPLTDGNLYRDIEQVLGQEMLFFHDAAAPIVFADSVNMDVAFRQSRYGHGGADYLNCPMNRNEYETFQKELVEAKRADLPDFEPETLFEGCMPIESMARRGPDTIRFGPLKPVGLVDPRTGHRPYACVQLRQDDRAASLYNMVGFQTRLLFEEQKRVFRLIPGLEQTEFARLGVMHRNSFICSPRLLNPGYSVRSRPSLYFAGQISGVEGYVESASSGLLAGIQAAAQARGLGMAERLEMLPSSGTITGALARYVADPRITAFQPMNANFGIVAAPETADAEKAGSGRASRESRRQAIIEYSLNEIDHLAGLSYNES